MVANTIVTAYLRLHVKTKILICHPTVHQFRSQVLHPCIVNSSIHHYHKTRHKFSSPRTSRASRSTVATHSPKISMITIFCKKIKYTISLCLCSYVLFYPYLCYIFLFSYIFHNYFTITIELQ